MSRDHCVEAATSDAELARRRPLLRCEQNPITGVREPLLLFTKRKNAAALFDKFWLTLALLGAPHTRAWHCPERSVCGADPWPSYLDALEACSPTIRAIGIADYYSTETYERLRRFKAEGRLPNCDIVFPNVEMRLALGTAKKRWVNVHLLVDPSDPDHLAELHRFLARLSFDAFGDSFTCSRADLIRLGKKTEARATEERDAFARGAEQFKVSFEQLRDAFKFDWPRQNIIVGVAGSEGDGISGMRDAADQVLRAEVERFAHFIFASSASQREFWLGRGGSLSEDDICARYGGLKPLPAWQ